jgi:hypothetical protein
MNISLVYKKGVEFRGIRNFLPLLQVVEKYPFPKPINCSRTNYRLHWLNTKITSFTSGKFLKYLEPAKRSSMHIVSVDENSVEHLTLSIGQNDISTFLLTNVHAFLTVPQMKQLFIDLIRCESKWDKAYCTTFVTLIFEKHFSNGNYTPLYWLQYFPKEELEWRGGFAAFESNPYVQTQRIHDGLLVQVGENPNVFDTPEGEQLLVNAINALPSLKH